MIPTSNGWYLKAVQLGLLSAYKSTFACTGWPHSSLPHMSKEGYRHCRSGVHMPACLHILHLPTYAPLAEVSRGLWQVSTKRWKRLELRWQNYQRKCVTPCWNICESRWFRIWRAFHVRFRHIVLPGNCLQIHWQGGGASHQDPRPWNLWGGHQLRGPAPSLHGAGQEWKVVPWLPLRHEHLRRAVPRHAKAEADLWTWGQWECCKLSSGNHILVTAKNNTRLF